MGQQQALLIVLSVMIVSIATYTGTRLFQTNNQEQNRDRIRTEITHLYVLAEEYKMKPKSLAGGGGSYTGFKLTQTFIDEPDVWYWVGAFNQTLQIYAYGTVIGNNGTTPVAIILIAPSGSYKMRMYTLN